MAAGMVAAPPCLTCGSPSTRIELVAPGELPAEWEQWNSQRQGFFLLHREPERWHLIFKGIATENGYMGDPIDASRAEQIVSEVPHGSRTGDPIGFFWKGTGSSDQESQEVFS
jgi:hypothetical protein